jgi:hypothetical protein
MSKDHPTVIIAAFIVLGSWGEVYQVLNKNAKM